MYSVFCSVSLSNISILQNIARFKSTLIMVIFDMISQDNLLNKVCHVFKVLELHETRMVFVLAAQQLFSHCQTTKNKIPRKEVLSCVGYGWVYFSTHVTGGFNNLI